MILAFDIGGSRIKAALWDGRPCTPMGEVATPAGDLAAFTATWRALPRPRARSGMAISIAGVVDPDTGIGKVANIPAMTGWRVAPALQARDLPVLVLNDADCFALAEARQGAGRGHANVFGVILGTGVGGGLVIDGRHRDRRGRLCRRMGARAGDPGRTTPFPAAAVRSAAWIRVGGARGLERLHLAFRPASCPLGQIIARLARRRGPAAKRWPCWRTWSRARWRWC
jgi:N-acetylglucosamine kinase